MKIGGAPDKELATQQMQAAIDNAKRTYECNISTEVDRIKKDMDIDKNGYPEFWRIIRPEFNATKHTKNGDINLINHDLKCPMNALYYYRPKHIRQDATTIPLKEFFIKHYTPLDGRKSKKIEGLIQKYSIDLYKYNANTNSEDDDYILLQNDLDDLIEDIRKIHIGNNYLGLMSYIIDRSLLVTDELRKNKIKLSTRLFKNRSLLLKVLYDISKPQLLQCFKSKIV